MTHNNKLTYCKYFFPNRSFRLSSSLACMTFLAKRPKSRLDILTTWPMEKMDRRGLSNTQHLQLLCKSLLNGLFFYSRGMLEKI